MVKALKGMMVSLCWSVLQVNLTASWWSSEGTTLTCPGLGSI